jgi:hypothetical protein
VPWSAGYRLSAIGYQLSAISYQLSAISYQLSVGDRGLMALFQFRDQVLGRPREMFLQ